VKLRALLVALTLFGAPTPLLADDAVVQRHVTVREAPASDSDAVDFVEPGDRLDLLDEGERRNGYYHVRLPDAREGWVYYTFVRPVPEAGGAAAAAPAAPAPGTYRIHSIDVGTGLAILVEGADFTLLYDAGSNDDTAREQGNRVLAYLRAVRPGLQRIDHLVLSHPHKDHSELMPDVVAAYDVGNIWDSGSVNPICSYRALLQNVAAESGSTYHHATGRPGAHSVSFEAKTCYGRPLPAATVTIVRAEPITIGQLVRLGNGAGMTVLHANGNQTNQFNEASVVVRLDLGRRRLLLPGDAEAGGRRPPSDAPNPASIEGELIACCAQALRADILVAGHHGSKTSSRTAFLDAIGASQYIVSAGPTKYATVTLPDREVVDALDRRGTVWRTDLDDPACKTNAAKIGPDNDNKPGGCDNVRILIDAAGNVAADYFRPAD
jgi:beta-lactamase superfamily II metal-dependent hydrolase